MTPNSTLFSISNLEADHLESNVRLNVGILTIVICNNKYLTYGL